MFKARMDYCGPKGKPLSEFLSWSQADQDNALWWQAHESRRCPQCGTHPDDWDEDPHAHHVEVFTCRGCEQVQARTETLSEARGQHVRSVKGRVTDCPRCKRT